MHTQESNKVPDNNNKRSNRIPADWLDAISRGWSLTWVKGIDRPVWVRRETINGDQSEDPFETLASHTRAAMLRANEDGQPAMFWFKWKHSSPPYPVTVWPISSPEEDIDNQRGARITQGLE